MSRGTRLVCCVLVGACVGLWAGIGLLVVGADGATALILALGAGLLATVGTAAALGV